jgi:uncharacterized protein YcgI (DUF1989 family)
MADRQIIPARHGAAARVGQGQTVRVINTHGTQVVDTWAFAADDMSEFMSMEHSRAGNLHLIPKVGDRLLTNRRRPILTLLEDSSGGIHDTLIAACDRWRYEQLGCAEYHRNCTDNLVEGLAALGLASPDTPSPLNLFMNIPWAGEDGRLSFDPPVCPPGGHVTFRAEMDLVIAFSACPQDMLPINGVDCVIRDAAFEIGD